VQPSRVHSAIPDTRRREIALRGTRSSLGDAALGEPVSHRSPQPFFFFFFFAFFLFFFFYYFICYFFFCLAGGRQRTPGKTHASRWASWTTARTRFVAFFPRFSNPLTRVTGRGYADRGIHSSATRRRFNRMCGFDWDPPRACRAPPGPRRLGVRTISFARPTPLPAVPPRSSIAADTTLFRRPTTQFNPSRGPAFNSKDRAGPCRCRRRRKELAPARWCEVAPSNANTTNPNVRCSARCSNGNPPNYRAKRRLGPDVRTQGWIGDVRQGTLDEHPRPMRSRGNPEPTPFRAGCQGHPPSPTLGTVGVADPSRCGCFPSPAYDLRFRRPPTRPGLNPALGPGRRGRQHEASHLIDLGRGVTPLLPKLRRSRDQGVPSAVARRPSAAGRRRLRRVHRVTGVFRLVTAPPGPSVTRSNMAETRRFIWRAIRRLALPGSNERLRVPSRPHHVREVPDKLRELCTSAPSQPRAHGQEPTVLELFLVGYDPTRNPRRP